jgi:type II secretory pathway pseudopilin PulG
MTARPFISDTRGFSLVELALSTTIIGILIGLVVGVAGMMDSARVTAAVTKVKTIEGAVRDFRETYHAWPGDFSAAMSMLNNCSASMRCGNGDGNGAILRGSSNLGFRANLAADVETRYAWRHLALSDFMPDSSNSENVLAWGKSHPRSGFGGGIEIFYGKSIFSQRGHFLRFSEVPPGQSLGNGDGLSSLAARAFDLKVDDGDPLAGHVMTSQSGGGGCLTAASAYDLSSSAQDCIVFLKLHAQ